MGKWQLKINYGKFIKIDLELKNFNKFYVKISLFLEDFLVTIYFQKPPKKGVVSINQGHYGGI